MMSFSIRWLGGAALTLAVLAGSAGAQSFAPYYGKNKVKYDKLDWQVYSVR